MENTQPHILDGFIPLLKQQRNVKRPVNTAPTFIPQNSFEQWQLYENGSTRRVYFYVNGTWRYVALT